MHCVAGCINCFLIFLFGTGTALSDPKIVNVCDASREELICRLYHIFFIHLSSEYMGVYIYKRKTAVIETGKPGRWLNMGRSSVFPQPTQLAEHAGFRLGPDWADPKLGLGPDSIKGGTDSGPTARF